MSEFIVWGATGQAIVLEELITSQNGKIIAFFENNSGIKSPFGEIPIFYGKNGFEDWKKAHKIIEDVSFLIAIGGAWGREREEIFNYIKSHNIGTKTLIHNTAFVASSAGVGEGSQVLAQSSVCARVKLGKSVIVNTSASIDHESVIGDFVHVAPGATICGCVNVGRNSFIGANSTILPRVSIGENVIIGAGTVVTKNVPDNVIVRSEISIVSKKNL